MKRNSHSGWYKEPDRRVELPDYPERAVEEGIVNSLIHRDYLIVGSEVHIDMFDDRIEIYSPGGMFDGINVQDRDIMNVPSRRRNPIIADIFARLKWMERRGRGIKKIIAEYKDQHYYADEMCPVFVSEYEAFFLTLKNLNYSISQKGTKKGTKIGTKKGTKTEEIQERVALVYQAICENPEVKNTELEEIVGASKKQICSALKILKDEEKIYKD